MQKLTRSLVEAQKPGGRDRVLWDKKLPRFGLRVRESGACVFIVRYRHQGRSRVVTLGSYPAITVDAARKAALRVLGSVEHGQDPAEERDKQRGAPTVAELAQRWLEQHVRPKLKARTVAAYEWLLRKYVLVAFGSRRAASLTRADVVRFHTSFGTKHHLANRTLDALREVLSFGVETGVLPANPARGIRHYKEPKRQRYLSDAELERLGQVLREAEETGVTPPAAVAGLRLLLFTGCRRSEIFDAKWRDVNLERGVLHLASAKSGARDVVLSEPALRVLETLPRTGEWIIPRGRHPARPIRIDRVWERLRVKAGLADVRLHDLRHAYASVAVASGVPLYTVGGLLGHSLPSTTARYAHLADDPLRRATELVGARIAAGLEGKPDAEVVPLRVRT